VRQIGKYAEDLQTNSSLVNVREFPGRELPEHGIDALGVRIVSRSELETIMDNRSWAFVDVRKDADVDKLGIIPGTVHHEYRHEGHSYGGSTQLTGDICKRLLMAHPGVVFLCNGPKCPRSFNACVAAVQLWGIAGDRVLWYRDGVPGWSKTALVPAGD
jgi:rhodanese-related sulfurtransferase